MFPGNDTGRTRGELGPAMPLSGLGTSSGEGRAGGAPWSQVDSPWSRVDVWEKTAARSAAIRAQALMEPEMGRQMEPARTMPRWIAQEDKYHQRLPPEGLRSFVVS